MFRTDLSVNYALRCRVGGRGELFAQFQILNLFNQFQLFNLSGNAINTTVLTADDDPDRFAAVQPVHRDAGAGHALGLRRRVRQADRRGAYTLPRTFRFSVGLRF